MELQFINWKKYPDNSATSTQTNNASKAKIRGEFQRKVYISKRDIHIYYRLCIIDIGIARLAKEVKYRGNLKRVKPSFVKVPNSYLTFEGYSRPKETCSPIGTKFVFKTYFFCFLLSIKKHYYLE